MKGTERHNELVERLAKINNFNRNFPHLIQELKKGNVWCWDDHGYTRELTDEQRKKIQKLEDEQAQFDWIIYAVVQQHWNVEGEIICVDSYLILSNELEDVKHFYGSNGRDSYYAMTATYSALTFGMADFGDIVICNNPAGGPVRVG